MEIQVAGKGEVMRKRKINIESEIFSTFENILRERGNTTTVRSQPLFHLYMYAIYHTLSTSNSQVK